MKDPVCGMMVEPSRAAACAEYEGRAFYFCSAHCQRAFQADPEKFTAPGAQPAGCGGCGCQGGSVVP